MSLLLLHTSMVSMDGRQILINTCCSCNYMLSAHFTECGKYNVWHFGTTAETISILYFSCTAVQVALILGPFVVCLFASTLLANVHPFWVYAFSFSVYCTLAGCILGHCQKCTKFVAYKYNKARRQCTHPELHWSSCTHHKVHTDILSYVYLPIFNSFFN